MDTSDSSSSDSHYDRSTWLKLHLAEFNHTKRIKNTPNSYSALESLVQRKFPVLDHFCSQNFGWEILTSHAGAVENDCHWQRVRREQAKRKHQVLKLTISLYRIEKPQRDEAQKVQSQPLCVFPVPKQIAASLNQPMPLAADHAEFPRFSVHDFQIEDPSLYQQQQPKLESRQEQQHQDEMLSLALAKQLQDLEQKPQQSQQPAKQNFSVSVDFSAPTQDKSLLTFLSFTKASQEQLLRDQATFSNVRPEQPQCQPCVFTFDVHNKSDQQWGPTQLILTNHSDKEYNFAALKLKAWEKCTVTVNVHDTTAAYSELHFLTAKFMQKQQQLGRELRLGYFAAKAADDDCATDFIRMASELEREQLATLEQCVAAIYKLKNKYPKLSNEQLLSKCRAYLVQKSLRH